MVKMKDVGFLILALFLIYLVSGYFKNIDISGILQTQQKEGIAVKVVYLDENFNQITTSQIQEQQKARDVFLLRFFPFFRTFSTIPGLTIQDYVVKEYGWWYRDSLTYVEQPGINIESIKRNVRVVKEIAGNGLIETFADVCDNTGGTWIRNDGTVVGNCLYILCVKQAHEQARTFGNTGNFCRWDRVGTEGENARNQYNCYTDPVSRPAACLRGWTVASGNSLNWNEYLIPDGSASQPINIYQLIRIDARPLGPTVNGITTNYIFFSTIINNIGKTPLTISLNNAFPDGYKTAYSHQFNKQYQMGIGGSVEIPQTRSCVSDADCSAIEKCATGGPYANQCAIDVLKISTCTDVNYVATFSGSYSFPANPGNVFTVENTSSVVINACA